MMTVSDCGLYHTLIPTNHYCDLFPGNISDSLALINPRPEGYGSRLVIHSFINPRPEGYGSRFVVHSFVHSFCPPRYREQRSLLRAS